MLMGLNVGICEPSLTAGTGQRHLELLRAVMVPDLISMTNMFPKEDCHRDAQVLGDWK